MNCSLIPSAVLLTACAGVIAGDPPVPAGERLRAIVADKYPDGNVFIGGTTGWGKLPRGSGIVLDREFGYVTPENDFKQSAIHPQPGVWKWEVADAWVERCAKQKQLLRLHGPISPQCSLWTLADDRTAEELRENLDEFMTALCKRYGRHPSVKWMDVVNETVSRDGSWHGPKPGVDKWENPWPLIGYDEGHPLRPPLYIKRAFEIATEHAPNTELIINQHGGMDDAVWDKIKALVLYLRAEGLRVDGIGWQAHVDLGFEKQGDNMERLGALIDWAHAHELSFHVTENNVWLKKEVDYAAQAETFAAIVRTLLDRRRSGVVTWNVWNISDGDQWVRTKAWKGCLLFDDFRPKPAYYAIQKALIDAAGKAAK